MDTVCKNCGGINVDTELKHESGNEEVYLENLKLQQVDNDKQSDLVELVVQVRKEWGALLDNGNIPRRKRMEYLVDLIKTCHPELKQSIDAHHVAIYPADSRSSWPSIAFLGWPIYPSLESMSAMRWNYSWICNICGNWHSFWVKMDYPIAEAHEEEEKAD